MEPVGANEIGLLGWAVADAQGEQLPEQLSARGVAHVTVRLDWGTVAGLASVVMYTSPATRKPVTVLQIPGMATDDWWISLYYFDAAALSTRPDWQALYHRAAKLQKANP